MVAMHVARLHTDLTEHRHALRGARDIDSAGAGGVARTPTFFVNGRRHDGAPHLDALSAEIADARTRLPAVTREVAPGHGT